MEENRRLDERFSVSLYVERNEPAEAPVHIRNMSASGFLVRGAVLAGQGGVFCATFRVHPASGDLRVTTRGKVMNSRRYGSESEFGIKIEGFGGPDEESAYQAYVRELAIKQV
jgi:hypothetical protein